jgi:dihydropteroate synthase
MLLSASHSSDGEKRELIIAFCLLKGESTRPGALPVDAEEELNRVVPVLRAAHADETLSKLVYSIDTRKVSFLFKNL